MFVASTLSTQITQSLYSHKITTHSEVQCRLRNIKDILRLNASYWNGYAIAMHWLSFDWMFEYISAILSEMQSAQDENTKTNRRCLVNKSSDPIRMRRTRSCFWKQTFRNGVINMRIQKVTRAIVQSSSSECRCF